MSKIILGIVLVILGAALGVFTFVTLFIGKYLGDITYMILWFAAVIIIILGVKNIVTNRHK